MNKILIWQRINSGLKSKELAEKASIHRCYYNRIERLGLTPSIGVQERIARILGLPRQILFRQEGN